MFSPRRAFVLLAYLFFTMTLLAAATPMNARTTPTVTVTVTAPATTTTISAGDCNTGSIQCCNSVEQANSGVVGLLLGLLGIVISDLNVLVGLTCSPITVIGVGGGACSANPVCCQDNSHGGLISIGCIPIIL